MHEKLITLTDGTKLEVKVNFMTLYLVQKTGLEKMLNKKKKLSDAENMEAAAKLIYIILRSNGMKVDEEEAMILTPMDPDEIKELFEEFGQRVEKYKKKEQAKTSTHPTKKRKKKRH
nr:MAG TPA: hypothetical protein [Caudoviricetes sp.]